MLVVYTYQIEADDRIAPDRWLSERDQCRKTIVYSFICPDGRRYIGSAVNGDGRWKKLGRTNPRIAAALETHPEETWAYEELARLPIAVGYQYAIEQMYIDMYQTMDPRHGFNISHADNTRTVTPLFDEDVVTETVTGYNGPRTENQRDVPSRVHQR